MVSRFSIPATALVLLLGCAGCSDGAPQNNVILISVDTLRPDFLGCYGYERNVSPAIDALAERGTIFRDVTTASPWTMPSHASMLTGLYPTTHGVFGHEQALESDTLAMWLSAAGYQTMAVVNSHNIGFEPYKILRGFDKDTRHWEFEVELFEDGTTGSDIHNSGVPILKRAIAYLEGREPDKPFFLFLHFYDVHTDFTPDPEWEEEFVTPYTGTKASYKTTELVKVRGQKIQLDEPDIRYLEEMYDAEIRTFDTKLAPFFDYLDASGLADTTVVAITSDHGEEYFEHGSVLHGRTHYQELVRIPLILRGPGVPAGSIIETPVHLVDVAPTLMRLAGVGVPEGLDGLDVSRAWSDPAALPSPRFLYSEADHNNVIDGFTHNNIRNTVRLGNHTLHLDKMTGKKELYDLATDPGEHHNIIDQEPELADLMFTRLLDFMNHKGAATEIGPSSAETLELLQKLGYIDGENPEVEESK